MERAVPPRSPRRAASPTRIASRGFALPVRFGSMCIPAKHPHDLFLGNYSVHTSTEALRRGEQEIRRIGQRLVAEGKRTYALREYGNARASR
jgi:hypothetical protein